MKNYIMHVENKWFCVKESKTGLILKKSSNKNQIWDSINKLNKGSGFAGESPNFFALKN